MDSRTIERVTRTLRTTADENGIRLDELIVFGSRVREDYRPDSDVDVLVVSPDFEGRRNYERPKPFYRAWEYGRLPDPEFVCLTPEEFDERRRLDPHLVRTAVEEGIAVV